MPLNCHCKDREQCQVYFRDVATVSLSSVMDNARLNEDVWLEILQYLFDEEDYRFLDVCPLFRRIFSRSVRRLGKITIQLRVNRPPGPALARLSKLLTLGMKRELRLHLHLSPEDLDRCSDEWCGPYEEEYDRLLDAVDGRISTALVRRISPHLGRLTHFSVSCHQDEWDDVCKEVLNALVVHSAPKLRVIYVPMWYRPSAHPVLLEGKELIAIQGIALPQDVHRITHLNFPLNYVEESIWNRMHNMRNLTELGLWESRWFVLPEEYTATLSPLHLPNLVSLYLSGNVGPWLDTISAPRLEYIVFFNETSTFALDGSPLRSTVRRIRADSFLFRNLLSFVAGFPLLEDISVESHQFEMIDKAAFCWHAHQDFCSRFRWNGLSESILE